jgi:hypothetical protein
MEIRCPFYRLPGRCPGKHGAHTGLRNHALQNANRFTDCKHTFLAVDFGGTQYQFLLRRAAAPLEALAHADVVAAKRTDYGFIKNIFRCLQDRLARML